MTPGTVALVTGTSSGFGLLASILLAERGLHVIATMRDLAKRGPLDDAARRAGVSLDVRALDVCDRESIEACASALESEGIFVDTLVNNAGIGLGGFFEDIDDDEVRQVMEANFFGVLAVTRRFLPAMRERRQGRIVNVTSIAAHVGQPAVSVYAASKFAVTGWADGLRHELRPLGISVTNVEPGQFRTEIFQSNMRIGRRAQREDSAYVARARFLLEMTERKVRASTADPADVARVIAEACLSAHPREHYVVGVDAKVNYVLRNVLPRAAFNWIVDRVARADLAKK
jgi:NAD(P)-dependent dehydrogenase (short-subunit alcohol dehydrogenase family)